MVAENEGWQMTGIPDAVVRVRDDCIPNFAFTYSILRLLQSEIGENIGKFGYFIRDYPYAIRKKNAVAGEGQNRER